MVTDSGKQDSPPPSAQDAGKDLRDQKRLERRTFLKQAGINIINLYILIEIIRVYFSLR